VWAITELAGGASALAFLTALSAPCPHCKTPNTVGRPVCVRCGRDLPVPPPDWEHPPTPDDMQPVPGKPFGGLFLGDLLPPT